MKTLSETNPYLKDKEQAKLLNTRSARSSCGVEGIASSNQANSVHLDESRSKAVFDKIQKRLVTKG